MADETKLITDHPLFQSALSYAKSMARILNQSTLTPNLLLAGFLTVIERDKNNNSNSHLINNPDEITKVLDDLGISAPHDLQPTTDSKLPLSDDLKKALSNSKEDIKSFIDALIGHLMATKTLAEPFFNQIIAYASFLSIEREEKLITPEIFSSAAYLAFLQGALATNQAFASYFFANQMAFEALITELSIHPDSKPDNNQITVPVSPDIIAAMSEADFEAERIFASLDIGLKTGSEIISRIATAYHEAGHAIVSSILRPTLSVTKVSIIKNDDYVGVTMYDKSNPYYSESTSSEELHSSLATCLAGRAAQLIKFGSKKIDDGAESDIERATDTAWRCIAYAGLDPEIGPVSLEVISKLQKQASGWLFDQVQKRVHTVLKEASDRAEKLLRANWDQVEIITKELLQKKDLSESDFASIMAGVKLTSQPGIQKAQSIPTDRDVLFANTNGIQQTPEGPVRYNVGDALITDVDGNQWPINRGYFEKHYAPKSGLKMGENGIYTRLTHIVNALQLTDCRRLDLSRGRGILLGQKDDWLVEYEDGEMSIVGGDQFKILYKTL